MRAWPPRKSSKDRIGGIAVRSIESRDEGNLSIVVGLRSQEVNRNCKMRKS